MIKKRIRGQDLGQSIGEEVILLGTVTKVRKIISIAYFQTLL